MVNTGLITVFTGSLTFLAFRQWRVMTAQGNAMNRQLEAYERPWLTASIAPDNLGENAARFGFGADGGAWVWFPFVIKNVGKSVATDISFVVSLVAVGHDHIVLSPERQKALHQLKTSKEEFSLFPGDDTGRLPAVGGVMGGDEIALASFGLVEGGAHFVSMAVIGRIIYRYATSDCPHHTEFAYFVGRKANNVKFVLEYPDPGVTLYSSDIEWIKAHGDHAD
jgi:hypothetical protein